MKNLIMAIVMIGTVFGANAACVGGEEITGKDGHVFCLSEESMNWWSAFQWCSAQGRHLATPDEACNYGKIHWGGGTCGNLHVGRVSMHTWLALARSSRTAYGVNLSDSLIQSDWLNRDSMHAYALCY